MIVSSIVKQSLLFLIFFFLLIFSSALFIADAGKSGRNQKAIDAYKQAIRIKPYHVKAHYNLGLTYFDLNNRGGVFEEYEILVTLDEKLASGLLILYNKLR